MKKNIRLSNSSKLLKIIVEEHTGNIRSSLKTDLSINKDKISKKKSKILFLGNNILSESRNFKKRNTDINFFLSKFNNKLNNKRNIINILDDIKDEKDKLINDNINEINNKSTQNLKRKKSHSFIKRKKTINIPENNKLNLVNNFFSNELKNNNLFITSPSKISKREKNHNKKNKSKIYLKKDRNQYKCMEKIKSLDEIIKEKEKKFDLNFKRKISFSKALNFLKNKFLCEKENIDEFKLRYNYIKSDIDKLTENAEKREKINLSNLKEYSLFKNKFKKDYKEIKKLNKDIINLRKKQYISANNIDTLKKYEKDLLINKNPEKRKMKELFENKKIDSFAFLEFSNKIKKLDGLVAFKHRYFLANKLGFNWNTINIYKKNQRHIIMKNLRKGNIYQNNKRSNEYHDNFLI